MAWGMIISERFFGHVWGEGIVRVKGTYGIMKPGVDAAG